MQTTSESSLSIEILPEDIKNGRRGNALNCPVSIACRRQFGLRFAIVTCRSIVFEYMDGKRSTFSNSDKLHDFIIDFDQQANVVPGRFLIMRCSK